MVEEKNCDFPSRIEGSGTLECMNHAAAVMFHIGSMLLPSKNRIRVTIECDPEKGKFSVKREVLP